MKHDKIRIPGPLQSLSLVALFLTIGFITFYAAANTIEVVSGKNVSFSNVVEDVSITNDTQFNTALIDASQKTFDEGSFGIPAKIRLPETSRHIDLEKVTNNNENWLASSGVGHTFITADEKRKVFGEAVIYLRINTSTTQHLGDVLPNDIVNIVTNKGWQLGYRVSDIASDISELKDVASNDSQIFVIMVDDTTGENRAFVASLSKVGERL